MSQNQAEELESSVLIVGRREALLEGIRDALQTRYRIAVEATPKEGAVELAVAMAPDLILLVGDAVGKDVSKVLRRFGASTLASVIPVVLLADDATLDDRLKALRFGATAVIPRSASVDAIASKVAELMREIPERSGRAFGELGEATLEDFVKMLATELRTGILSVRDAEADESAAVRLVLGEGQDLNRLVQDFVSRVGSVVSSAEVLQYEFEEHRGGSLEVLGGDEDVGEDALDIAGLRLVVADRDAARADAVAQELRYRGATVVIGDVTGRRLERLRGLDPHALIIGHEDLKGDGFALVRAMREDPRLRWAFMLAVKWDEVWDDKNPAVDSLVARLYKLLEVERRLMKQVAQRRPFDARLEVLGPARLVRLLAEVREPVRCTVANARVQVRVDFAEQLVVGAEARLAVEQRYLTGPQGLAALLVLGSGRVRIEPVDNPVDATIMATAEVALGMADQEEVPLDVAQAKVGLVTGPGGQRIEHVASAKTDRPGAPDVGVAPPVSLPRPPGAPKIAVPAAPPPVLRAAPGDAPAAVAATDLYPSARPEPFERKPHSAEYELDRAVADAGDKSSDAAPLSSEGMPKAPPEADAADATDPFVPTEAKKERGATDPSIPLPMHGRIAPVPPRGALPDRRHGGLVASLRDRPVLLSVLVALVVGVTGGAASFLLMESPPAPTRDSHSPAAEAAAPPVPGPDDEQEALEAGEATRTAEAEGAAPSEEAREGATDQGEEEYVIPKVPIPERILSMSEEKRRKKGLEIRQLAQTVHDQGRYDRAERWWLRAWMHEPGAPATAAGMALTLAEEGRLDEALAWAKRAVAVEPTEGEFRAVLGDVYEKRKDLARALNAYEQAAHLSPSSTRIKRRLEALRQESP